jgi:outer membrane protein assembly factor BamB
MLDRDTFVAVEDNRLVGIDVADGSLRWSRPITITVRDAALDAGRSVIYISNYVGEISAFGLPNPSDQDLAGNTEMVVEPLWEIDLDPVGLARLVSLPNGGVAASFRGQVVGVSPSGKVVWEHDTEWSVFDWVSVGDSLLFSTVGAEASTWKVNDVGRMTGAAPVGGHMAVAADRVWVYDQDGIYWLDPETLSGELLYALPWGSPRLGDMIVLPDGGVLVAHSDRADRRLIVLSPDGRLRWQRSISDGIQGQVRLLMVDGHPFLVSQYDSVSGREVSVFAIDLEDAELTRIFTGGSRNPLLNETWAFAAGEGRILVNIADSGMAALDPQLALEVVIQAATAQ